MAPERLPERILVPFPTQSALSGIGRNENESWYRRSFRVPRSFGDRRIVLHFGAVTHAATVSVNGRRVGRHAGSYDAFSFDVTDAVRRRGRNTVVVRVSDPMAYGGGQPVGKQASAPISVLFTASTGIWQTVWLEAVDRRLGRLVAGHAGLLDEEHDGDDDGHVGQDGDELQGVHRA